MPVTSKKPKLSRADQREQARAAILEAAIACLIEDGYSAASTRRVGERAGMSQGAVQNYFPTRAALLDAAVRRMADRTAAFVIENYSAVTGSEREKAEALVDAAWEIAHTPDVTAGLDLLVAARTDPELATILGAVVEYIDVAVIFAARSVLGNLADVPAAKDWTRTTLATIGGALLMSAAPATAALMPQWPTMRAHIMAGFDAVLAERH